MTRTLRTMSLPWKLASTAVLCIAALTLVSAPMEASRARDVAMGNARSQVREELREMEEIMRVTGRADLVRSSHGDEPHISISTLSSSGDGADQPWMTLAGSVYLSSPEPVEVISVDDRSHWLAVGDQLTSGGIGVSVVSAVPMDGINEQGEAAMRRAIRLGVVAMLLLGFGAYVVSALSLRAVRRIRLSAQRVAEGVPGATVDIPTAQDERRVLAQGLDVILGDLRRSVEARDRFLVEASHELRTPVTRLRTEVDLALLRERSAVELVESLQGVRRHAAVLERLVNQLLDLARVDQLDHPTTCEVDLQEVVCEAVEICAAECSVDCRVHVVGDPSLLRRAIVNLVENAERYGTPPIVITAERRDHDVVLRVTDSGVSTPESSAVRDASLMPEHRSGGFGLSIVERVATLHGGSFRLIRDEGATISELTITDPMASTP